jgi:hypothetical protein
MTDLLWWQYPLVWLAMASLTHFLFRLFDPYDPSPAGVSLFFWPFVLVMIGWASMWKLLFDLPAYFANTINRKRLED